MLGRALRFLGVFLSVVMAIGSAFGATNTLLIYFHSPLRAIRALENEYGTGWEQLPPGPPPHAASQ